MSAELRLIVAPRDTYARLARVPSRIGPVTALRRPFLVALVFGAWAAIAATRHVTPALLLSTTLCWAFVVLLQIAIVLPLIAGPSRRTVGLPRALDLFFASHAPWSLWLLALAAYAPSPLSRPFTPVWVTAFAPILLTPRMISAFFREVLELDPREAKARTVVHQAITWAILLVLAGMAVSAWPRVLERIG
jgi:hypothetical protein